MTYDGVEKLADNCDREVEAKRLKHVRSGRTPRYLHESRLRKELLWLRAEQQRVRRQHSRLRSITRGQIRNDKQEGLNLADCTADRTSHWSTRTNILPDGCSSAKVRYSYDGKTFSGHCPFCRFPLGEAQWKCACNGVCSTTGNKAEKHDRLLSFARQRKHCSGECEAVVDYFLHTIRRTDLRVLQVERLQNPSFIKQFRSGASQQIMFHGCSTLKNEEQILENGFQVSKAVSYPKGTWLASNASYSDCGFAIYDNGIKHLLLCLVSDAEVILDSTQERTFWYPGGIRVVGQDCAYPVWLVKYTDCEGVSMHNEYDGAWYEEDSDAEYERIEEVCERVDRRVNFRAQFDDVLVDAGRHRKSRSRGSDVMRGSGHIFQRKHHSQVLHNDLAYAEPSKHESERKVQDRAARMKQKMRSCARREAASIQMQYLMQAI